MLITAVRVLAADPAYALENVANTFRRIGPTALLSLCLALNLASGAKADALYGLSTDTGGVGDLLIRMDPNTAEVASTISLNAKTLGSPQGQNWDFPTNIAFAPDGTLYGLSTDTGGVGDLLIGIDPNTAEVTSTISLNAKTLGSPQGQNWDFPTNIAFAPDGTLYGLSTDTGGVGDLLIRIDPNTAEVTSTISLNAKTLGSPQGQNWDFPTDIAFAPDGTLYGLSTDTGGVGDLLIRIDPNTAEVTGTISLNAKTLGNPQGQNWDFPTDIAFAPGPSNVSAPEPPSSLLFGFGLVATGVIASLSSMRRRPA